MSVCVGSEINLSSLHQTHQTLVYNKLSNDGPGSNADVHPSS